MLGWRSQWRLVLLNSLTCGLEICAAAGITYVPPLLLEAGMEERYMTMVLGKDPGGRRAPYVCKHASASYLSSAAISFPSP